MTPSTSSIAREEYLKKKRNRKLIKYSLFFLALVSIIALVSYIAHRPQIRISKIELSGGVLVTQQDIESKTFPYIQGSYIWLLPKNNIFLYPHDKLETYLKETFKRIDTIDVHMKDLHTLSIDITEKKPQALWCDGMRLSESDRSTEDTSPKCYFMDANGTIFSEAPQFSGDAYFKYYSQASSTSPIGTQYIASSTEFSDIVSFVEKARVLKLRPLYLIAKENGEFSLTISGGGEIYFDTKKSLITVGENLEALIGNTPELKPLSNGDLPVEYIDLRFGNKLFYKLK